MKWRQPAICRLFGRIRHTTVPAAVVNQTGLRHRLPVYGTFPKQAYEDPAYRTKAQDHQFGRIAGGPRLRRQVPRVGAYSTVPLGAIPELSSGVWPERRRRIGALEPSEQRDGARGTRDDIRPPP